MNIFLNRFGIFGFVPNSRSIYANNLRFTEIILITSNVVDSFIEWEVIFLDSDSLNDYKVKILLV